MLTASEGARAISEISALHVGHKVTLTSEEFGLRGEKEDNKTNPGRTGTGRRELAPGQTLLKSRDGRWKK